MNTRQEQTQVNKNVEIQNIKKVELIVYDTHILQEMIYSALIESVKLNFEHLGDDENADNEVTKQLDFIYERSKDVEKQEQFLKMFLGKESELC